jgi:hypothetical protein
MCPLCLASGLYIAGGISTGGVTTFLATKILRKRNRKPAPTIRPMQGERHATTENRIEG